MPDPFQRILGRSRYASPLELLGLSPQGCGPLQIEAALRDALARTYQHAEGRSAEAEDVRQALRSAAEQLKKRASGPDDKAWRSGEGARFGGAPHSAIDLTPFDRLVLAVLVGCGGWNAQSRARLVSLSSSYGVSAYGLMRVVYGLSEYARSGGPPLAATDISAGRTLSPFGGLAQSIASAGEPALLDRMAESLATELRREDPWPTIKLSVLFGLATLLVGVIALRLLIASGPRSTTPVVTPRAGQQANLPTSRQFGSQRAGEPSSADGPRLAHFPSYPTFLGNALPVDAVKAVDECPALPASLDEIARKLTVADEPSEAVFRNWQASLHTIAMAWVLVDASTSRLIEQGMFEALRSGADMPSVSDRLLGSLTPPPSIGEPLDLWRGAWSTGMLAKISAATSLPPVVVQRARAQLELVLVDQESQQSTFDAASRAWLDRQLPQLVATLEFDERTYDTFEAWLTAQRALGRGPAYDASVVGAIVAVLATDTDLSRPGPSLNVLGRLVAVALEDPSFTVRQGILGLFERQDVTTRDLWILTSVLARSDLARWFDDELVVPEDADQGHRERIRDDLARAWPSADVSDPGPAGEPVRVDATVAQRWGQAQQLLLSKPLERRPEDLMRQLILTSRMVESAEALLAQDAAQAGAVLDEIEAALGSAASESGQRTAAGPATAPGAVKRAGQPIGRDGEWAAGYQQIGKNVEQKADLLRSLRVNAGTDLGPTDAAIFVHEVYRGSPAEIRLLAQSIVSQQFETGPTIAMEMLDQFPEAPINEAVSLTIEQLTGEMMQRPGSTGWTVAARAALVRHALELRGGVGEELDVLAEQLIESYGMRLAYLKHQSAPGSAPRSAQEAARLLAAAWLEQATLSASGRSDPAQLPALQRRHRTRLRLAAGPMQDFVASQLFILDLLSYITSAERPAARELAIGVQRTSSDARARLASVLEQAVEVERAMVRIWSLRMNVAASAEAIREAREP